MCGAAVHGTWYMYIVGRRTSGYLTGAAGYGYVRARVYGMGVPLHNRYLVMQQEWLGIRAEHKYREDAVIITGNRLLSIDRGFRFQRTLQ